MLAVLAGAVVAALVAIAVVGVARGQKGGPPSAPAAKGTKGAARAAGAKGAGAPPARTTGARPPAALPKGVPALPAAPGAAKPPAAAGKGVPQLGGPAGKPAGTEPQIAVAPVMEPFEDWRVNPFLEYPLTREQIAALMKGPSVLAGSYRWLAIAVPRYRAPAGWYRIPPRAAAPTAVGPGVGVGAQPVEETFGSAENLLGPEAYRPGVAYGRMEGLRTSAVMLGQRTNAVIEWPSGNAIVVTPGMQIAGGYVVDSILADQVILRDPQGQLRSVPLAARPAPRPTVAPPRAPAGPTYYTPYAPPAGYPGYYQPQPAPGAPAPQGPAGGGRPREEK